MPHILISTKVRLESGPTVVGDQMSDPELMKYLNAQIYQEKCNNLLVDLFHRYFIVFIEFSFEYRTDDCPRLVLDKLENADYRVVAMTGIGQTCIWLLEKK